MNYFDRITQDVVSAAKFLGVLVLVLATAVVVLAAILAFR